MEYYRGFIFGFSRIATSLKGLIKKNAKFSEFVLQSRYYVHFRVNALGKSMNPLILQAMG